MLLRSMNVCAEHRAVSYGLVPKKYFCNDCGCAIKNEAEAKRLIALEYERARS